MTKILLIDDERDFVDGREATVIRSSWEAIEHFTESEQRYDEVWLDFILEGSDDIMPFVKFASEKLAEGKALNVGKFVIHTSSWSAVGLMKSVLEGYETERFDIAAQQVPNVIIR